MSLYAGIGNDFKEFLNTLIDEKAINEKISSRFSSMFANPLEINLKGKGVSLTSSNHKFDGIGPDLNKKLDYFDKKLHQIITQLSPNYHSFAKGDLTQARGALSGRQAERAAALGSRFGQGAVQCCLLQ